MANNTRSKTEYFKGLPGPYEGIVVGHLDPAYMGTLKVEIIKKTSSGNDPERSGQMVEARYLSPFYGVTPQAATTGNSGYENTQKSYGMWMVPPDVGTRVIVILVEGNISQAFWIGCVQDEYMNFMTPGYAATKQVENITDNPSDKINKKVPVGEYNKRREIGTAKNPTKFLKPPHSDIINHLNEQGLIDDDIRGTTSSSARREVPSTVFGISTPGPLDKRANAPKNPIGPFEAKATQFTNRLGGTSFVMDDGDDKIIRKGPASTTPPEYENIEALAEGETVTGDVTLPANELTRIRTRTGHQILLHNTEDLIYIGNARGTSWIEMTSNGKIDIYAQDSVSVHTSNDLNFTADRDINFTAGENVNFMVGKDVRTTAGDGIHNTAGLNINNTAGQGISEIAGTNISNYANIDASYQSVRNTVVNSGKNLDLSSGGNTNLESSFHTHIVSGRSSKLEIKEGDFALKARDLNVSTANMNLESADVSMSLSRLTLHSSNQINLSCDRFIVNADQDAEINAKGNFYSLVDGEFNVRANDLIKLQSVNDSINFRAETDVITWAKTGNIHSLAATDVKVQAAAGVLTLESGDQTNLKSAAATHIEAANAINVKSGSVISVKGTQTQLQPTGNVAEADAADLLPADIIVNPFISYVKWHKYDLAVRSLAQVYADLPPLPPTFAVDPTPAIYADRVARMPMHEPWYQHENLNPLAFTPDKTRAGSETPDIYNPQIPDTFATTPTAQDNTKTESVVFEADLIIQGEGTEFNWGSDYSYWLENAQQFNLSDSLISAVYGVIVSQYGSWDLHRTETLPTANDIQEQVNLVRKRYRGLVHLKDSQIQTLIESGEQTFFQTAYGYQTTYGKSLGNTKTQDGYNFRGHGPYLGLVGKGIFEKLKIGVQNFTGVTSLESKKDPFELTNGQKLLMLAYYVQEHYQDHGRGTLGNVRIMLFGNEDYEIMHKRDVIVMESQGIPVRTLDNAS